MDAALQSSTTLLPFVYCQSKCHNHCHQISERLPKQCWRQADETCFVSSTSGDCVVSHKSSCCQPLHSCFIKLILNCHWFLDYQHYWQNIANSNTTAIAMLLPLPPALLLPLSSRVMLLPAIRMDTRPSRSSQAGWPLSLFASGTYTALAGVMDWHPKYIIWDQREDCATNSQAVAPISGWNVIKCK